MKDFFAAAFPWLVMGLCIAILCAKLSQNNTDDENNRSSFLFEGMVLGLILGVTLGKAFALNTGLSLSMGMLAGMTAGACIKKKTEE